MYEALTEIKSLTIDASLQLERISNTLENIQQIQIKLDVVPIQAIENLFPKVNCILLHSYFVEGLTRAADELSIKRPQAKIFITLSSVPYESSS